MHHYHLPTMLLIYYNDKRWMLGTGTGNRDDSGRGRPHAPISGWSTILWPRTELRVRTVSYKEKQLGGTELFLGFLTKNHTFSNPRLHMPNKIQTKITRTYRTRNQASSSSSIFSTGSDCCWAFEKKISSHISISPQLPLKAPERIATGVHSVNVGT